MLIEAEMTETDLKSVENLRYMSDSYLFVFREGEVKIYSTWESANKGRPNKKITPEELFEAVDYYYDNREAEHDVNEAMKKPEGKVKVFSPHKPEDPLDRVPLLEIPNYMVPQILEFAYGVARQELKKK